MDKPANRIVYAIIGSEPTVLQSMSLAYPVKLVRLLNHPLCLPLLPLFCLLQYPPLEGGHLRFFLLLLLRFQVLRLRALSNLDLRLKTGIIVWIKTPPRSKCSEI